MIITKCKYLINTASRLMLSLFNLCKIVNEQVKLKIKAKDKRYQDRKPFTLRQMENQFCAERQNNLPRNHQDSLPAFLMQKSKATQQIILLIGLSGKEQLLHHTHTSKPRTPTDGIIRNRGIHTEGSRNRG